MQDSGLFKLVQSLVQNIIDFVPSLIGAIIVFLIGWIIARIVRKGLKSVLEKVGVDKIGESIERIDIVRKSGMSIKISSFLSSIFYYLLMLIFVVAIVVMGVGLLIADFLKNIVHTACKSIGIPAYSMIANIVFYFVLINVLILALSQAKIDTDFLKNNLSLILAGIIFAFALGYGIASKDLASNFLASFYLRNKFNVGDEITIGGIKGSIVEIDTNYVKVKTATSTQLVPIIKLITESVEIHDK